MVVYKKMTRTKTVINLSCKNSVNQFSHYLNELNLLSFLTSNNRRLSRCKNGTYFLAEKMKNHDSYSSTIYNIHILLIATAMIIRVNFLNILNIERVY